MSPADRASTLSPEHLEGLGARIESLGRELAATYPGDPPDRQPVHTVYGGAHLFRADLTAKLGGRAQAFLAAYGPDPIAFARAVGLPLADQLPGDPGAAAALHERYDADSEAMRAADPAVWLACTVYARMVAKLEHEPLEDFRIDFEDGYGTRSDADEDATAAQAAEETAKGIEESSLPPFIGIRIKAFGAETWARAARTLDLYLSTLVRRAGRLPEGFVVTLPKPLVAAQVAALADTLDALEDGLGLERGAVPIEIMVEMPQAILDADGRCVLPEMVRAARGRCRGAHFGVYDYTAGCNITAWHQVMAHRSCDYARHAMQVSLAGTGVTLSDGATNVIPAPPHRPGPDGELDPEQRRENRIAVHRAWRLHYDDVRRSLAHGFYQGWDLNPAQLPTRYAAVYAFFLEAHEAAAERLRNFVEQAAQATIVGDVFDDAATGQGLLNFFLRAIGCGAITEREAAATGLSFEEIRLRSFARILARRREG